MAEDPELKKKIEPATDRANRWMANQVAKTKTHVVCDADPPQGLSRQTQAPANHNPQTEYRAH